MVEEKDLKQALAVYNSLCEMLDENEFHYDKDVENLKIHFSTSGDDLPIELAIQVDVDRKLVTLLSWMPFKTPENRRVPMAIAISAANNGLLDGSFDYNILDGQIIFRMTSSYRESLLGKNLFAYMLLVSCQVIDDYNDTFFAVAKTEMSVADILNYIE